MKRIKYLIVILFIYILGISNVFAYTYDFEPVIGIDPLIEDNQIKFVIGFYGDEIKSMSQTISYNKNDFTLTDIYALEDFTVETKPEKTEGKYKTVSFSASSNTAYDKINFAVVVFSLKDSFKVGKKSEIFFYNYVGIADKDLKYRHKGSIIKVIHDTKSQMMYSERKITDKTKLEYWFVENFWYLIAGVGVVVLVIIIILSIPTRRKEEHRDKMMKDNIKKVPTMQKSSVKPLKLAVEDNRVKVDEDLPAKKDENKETTIVGFGASKYENIEQNSNNSNNLEAPVDAFNQKAFASAPTSEPNVPKNNPNVSQEPKTEDIELPKPKPKKEEDLVLFQPKFIDENKDEIDKL